MSAQVTIKKAQKQDLPLLEREMRPNGLLNYHERRFLKQEEGKSAYLIAWKDGKPVGHIVVSWDVPDETEVRVAYPNTPLLIAAGVKPALQSQGIGTQLITSAEQLVRQKGYTRIGLNVGIENIRARTLYERLGYRDGGLGQYLVRWPIITKDGKESEESETCIFLTKYL